MLYLEAKIISCHFRSPCIKMYTRDWSKFYYNVVKMYLREAVKSQFIDAITTIYLTCSVRDMLEIKFNVFDISLPACLYSLITNVRFQTIQEA